MSRIICIENYNEYNSYQLDDVINIAKSKNAELWVFIITPFAKDDYKSLQALNNEINRTISVKGGTHLNYKLIPSNREGFMEAAMDIYPIDAIVAEGVDFSTLMESGLKSKEDMSEVFRCPVLTKKKQKKLFRLYLIGGLSLFLIAIVFFYSLIF